MSVNNLNKKAENPRCNRKLTARCPDNVNAVRDSIGRSLKKSFRRRSLEPGLSHASLQRILMKDFLLYPYRIQNKYKLTPANMEFLVSVINHYHINGLHQFETPCINYVVYSFTDSQPSLNFLCHSKNWCSIYAICSKSSLKHSIRYLWHFFLV